MVTTNQKEQVKAAIEAYLEKASQNQLAQKSGVSAAVLSFIRRGEFSINGSPISDSMFGKLLAFFNIREVTGRPKLHWENARQFQGIQNACRVAQRDGRRILVDGFTGCGKTYALEHYYRENQNVIYQKCTSSMVKRSLLKEIMEKLGVKSDKKDEKSWMDAINARLKGQSGWLIIFDETEGVPLGIYKAIKEIEDFTKDVAGIVVIGHEIERMLKHNAEIGKECFPQLYRRLSNNVVRLGKVTKDDIRDRVKETGIHQPEVVKWFCNNVDNYDKLNQYLSDLILLVNGDMEKVTVEVLNDLFN